MDEEGWHLISNKGKRSRVRKKPHTQACLNQFPQGRIIRIDRGKVHLYSQGVKYRCTFKKRMFLEKNNETTVLCVGDLVHFDSENQRIVSKLPRFSYLKRKEQLRGKEDQVLVANVDTVCIVSSVATPQLKPSYIDRAIISCYKGNLKPVVVINKADLISKNQENTLSQVIQHLSARDIPYYICSAKTKEGLNTLRKHLNRCCSFFTGQSGVGKTSLINALFSFDLKVNTVGKNEKGKHTTTSSQLIPLKENMFIVDAPGIKSFGLCDLSVKDVIDYFVPLFGDKACRFSDCTHQKEPGCQVLQQLEQGDLCPSIYRSYTNLLKEVFC